MVIIKMAFHLGIDLVHERFEFDAWMDGGGYDMSLFYPFAICNFNINIITGFRIFFP